MKLQRLQLTNFRGFEHLDLPFHDRLTVLVGVNGSGKSSVLDALSVTLEGALQRAWTALYPAPTRHVEEDDIHDGRLGAVALLKFQAEGRNWRHEAQWEIETDLGGMSSVTIGPSSSDGNLAGRAYEWLSMAYPVRRAVIDDKPITDLSPNQQLSPLLAYQDSLTGRGSFTSFLRWFRAREDIENEQRLRGNPSTRDPQLHAVRQAITRMMPGYDDFFVQRHPRESMMLSKHGQKMSLSQLSDGEKCLLAVVGDIARRMAMISGPDISPLEEVQALVMIDEIELHLHPRWQREVVPRLLKTFPKTQFVLTTHSPQVLGSVAQESIVVLDDFKIYTPTQPVEGRDANAILREVMGTTERPQTVLDRVKEVEEAIDREKLDEASQKIDELRELLGPEDDEVVRLTTMLHFLGVPSETEGSPSEHNAS